MTSERKKNWYMESELSSSTGPSLASSSLMPTLASSTSSSTIGLSGLGLQEPGDESPDIMSASERPTMERDLVLRLTRMLPPPLRAPSTTPLPPPCRPRGRLRRGDALSMLLLPLLCEAAEADLGLGVADGTPAAAAISTISRIIRRGSVVLVSGWRRILCTHTHAHTQTRQKRASLINLANPCTSTLGHRIYQKAEPRACPSLGSGKLP